jgi:hypothetical protein
MSAPGRTIFIIRHGEKPGTATPPFGVDEGGNQDEHSLVPRGWQRAGALVTLFAPQSGQQRAGIATPTELISPNYGDPTHTEVHRTYETIEPLGELLKTAIATPYPEGQEGALGQSAAAATQGVTLICWEHTAIPAIANGITPVAAGTQIPQSWPDARFDLVWSFAFDADASAYVFSELSQLLLAGDS